MNLLLAPHVTEKTSTALQKRNQYTFRVRRDATRTEVQRRRRADVQRQGRRACRW